MLCNSASVEMSNTGYLNGVTYINGSVSESVKLTSIFFFIVSS